MPEDVRRPSFRNPPVVEVACGVQFETLELWNTTHFGQFAATIRDTYPTTQDHPPLAPIRLGERTAFEPVLSPLPPLRRVFFIDPSGNFLIQLQPNRFLHNWRRTKDLDQYPRYDTAFDKFVSAWNGFAGFLSSVAIPPPRPDIWELTYINHIMGSGDARFPRDVWDYLAFYEKSPSAVTPMPASSMAMQFSWPLAEGRGTLVLDAKHGNRVDDQREVLVVELTVRGPASDEPGSMNSWFDVAHHAIVNTFEKFTTAQAHNIWEKI